MSSTEETEERIHEILKSLTERIIERREASLELIGHARQLLKESREIHDAFESAVAASDFQTLGEMGLLDAAEREFLANYDLGQSALEEAL